MRLQCKQSGHAYVMTSQRYIQPVPETIQQAMGKAWRVSESRGSRTMSKLEMVAKREIPGTDFATSKPAQSAAAGK
jgi:hypothetical protein